MLLSNVKEGTKVKIINIKDIFLQGHLSKIGILTDNYVLVTKKSFGQSPIAIQTEDGVEIAIRKDVAENIEVELLEIK